MLLDEFVRIVTEDAVTPSLAFSRGLSLARLESGRTLVLYDGLKVLNDWRDSTIISANCIGMISLSSQQEWFRSVKASAADRRYGPLLYDAALVSGWTCPDRLYTSPSAFRVWQKYSQRQDVEMRQLDEKFRREPDEHETDIVNYAYRLTSCPNTQRLIAADRRVREILQQGGASVQQFDEKLRSCASKKFDVMFVRANEL